ncbi:MAG TPA: ABC transporter permease [Bryobacteraceae bacterium]|jgi:putative ABC transport system permease protein|nr:ABC transporter permease [Bryobacteraceae bacterium]
MTAGEVRENLLVALDTLRSRKLRSGLTVLGIVIGVTSVISVAAIIDGLNGYIRGRIQTMGSRSIFITRIPPGFLGARLPEKVRTRKYLQYGDAGYLQEAVPGVAYATTFANRINFGEAVDQIRYGAAHVERIFVRGVEPEYAHALELFSVAQGRFVSQYDLEHARPVAVIGAAIADSLFPHMDPLGKMVRLNGRIYEIIGVFDKDPGLFGGFGVDQFVCIPLTNFHKNYPEIRELFILVSIRDDADLPAARDQLIDAMRRRRHVAYHAENDFEVSDASFFTNLWDQLTGAMVLLTGIISSIGLLVGGIGVMNIMLISVTERTQEIGVRKAIGARKSDIRVQFLLEAVTLSGVGGAIGILSGAAVAFLVRKLIPSIPATLSPFWVTMGVAISIGVGLFFGYYPANRAANLDPIVCLRYE